MAMEIFRRIDRRAATGAAPDSTRILRAGRDGSAESDRPLVSVVHRPWIAVHIRRSRDRVGALQPALRGTADGGGVLASRSQPDQCLVDTWCVADPHLHARRVAAVDYG